MAGINLVSPTSFTSAVLIADEVRATGGSNDSISTMTKSGANVVNACLELQSTTGLLLLPRLTSTQEVAIPTIVNGMMYYNSTLNGVQIYSNSSVTSIASATGVALTSANITGMYAAPVQVLPAPGAGLAYLILGFSINYSYLTAAYTAGGVVSLQYGNTVHAGAGVITNTMAVTIFNSATNTIGYATGTGVVVTGTEAYVNTAVYISNATQAFATGSGTAFLEIYYQIIQAT